MSLNTSTTCSVTHDAAFVQPAINYKFGNVAATFVIPTYNKSEGCPSGETLDIYKCKCSKNTDENFMWSPTPDYVISFNGGSIYETDTA